MISVPLGISRSSIKNACISRRVLSGFSTRANRRFSSWCFAKRAIISPRVISTALWLAPRHRVGARRNSGVRDEGLTAGERLAETTFDAPDDADFSLREEFGDIFV